MLGRFDIFPLPLWSVSGYKGAKDASFRERVGCLMGIANHTRLDIADAVTAVARHSHDPKDTHWKAMQQIRECLLTARPGLTYRVGSEVDVRSSV